MSGFEICRSATQQVKGVAKNGDGDGVQGGKFCVRRRMTELPGPSSALHGSGIHNTATATKLYPRRLGAFVLIMSQIPTPPASRPGSEAPEAVVKPADSADNSSELRRSLDTLLEQYLHLLDRQQQLQSGLSKELSSV